MTWDGVSVAVAPDGRPLADSETLPLNPLRAETVTVADPLLPCGTLSDEGETESEKSDATGGVTDRLRETVCVSCPLTPLAVTV